MADCYDTGVVADFFDGRGHPDYFGLTCEVPRLPDDLGFRQFERPPRKEDCLAGYDFVRWLEQNEIPRLKRRLVELGRDVK